MIQAVVGGKGTGKTKTLVNMANKALEEAKGEIVFISGEKRRMIELNHRIRLVRLREFDIKDLEMFYGFLNGIIAQNYDIEMIYIDGLLEFLNEDIASIGDFLSDMNRISEKFNIKFIISMNGDPSSVPTFLKEYIA
ncbi:MAG: hypothetical protein WBI74_01055 [Caldicoprobacterales bacterium]|jgi:energy-coupling factor transporter ATP-binding protein EcfA2|nr:hypothetical protein [Clostridiales bacterium]